MAVCDNDYDRFGIQRVCGDVSNPENADAGLFCGHGTMVCHRTENNSSDIGSVCSFDFHSLGTDELFLGRVSRCGLQSNDYTSSIDVVVCVCFFAIPQ